MPAPRRIKTSYNARTKSGHTLKKKIRDAERLLSRPSLPADKKIETERALAAWKLELEAATKSRIEHKMDQKYRMVKFFERKKIQRELSRVRKKAAACEGKVPKELKDSIHAQEVLLNYTLHYPKGEVYISALKDLGENIEGAKRREEIKKDISRRMKKGTLGAPTQDDDEEMEEAEETEKAAPTTKAKADKPRAPGKKNRWGEKTEVETIENDDFFEF
ncbi:hypothetical protein BZA77DRAFT_299092 [Pyronema omphalodes]|nr:hypothetical protein BZA77DRAFT_299092 [Pyronema omphalodes]